MCRLVAAGPPSYHLCQLKAPLICFRSLDEPDSSQDRMDRSIEFGQTQRNPDFSEERSSSLRRASESHRYATSVRWGALYEPVGRDS